MAGKKRQKIQKRRWALQGRGHEMSGDPPTVVLEWRDRTQIEPTMNSKRKITAIDREHNKWKQNQSSGGAHMDHEVPKCLKYDVRCGALLPMTPCDSASLEPTNTGGLSLTSDPHHSRRPVLPRLERAALLRWPGAHSLLALLAPAAGLGPPRASPSARFPSSPIGSGPMI